MTNKEYINQIVEIGNTLQIQPNSPKGQTLKKCIEILSAVSEREQGEWIYDGDCYICNQCKSAFNWWADSQTSNYCPNCGAKMKGGEEK